MPHTAITVHTIKYIVWADQPNANFHLSDLSHNFHLITMRNDCDIAFKAAYE